MQKLRFCCSGNLRVPSTCKIKNFAALEHCVRGMEKFIKFFWSRNIKKSSIFFTVANRRFANIEIYNFECHGIRDFDGTKIEDFCSLSKFEEFQCKIEILTTIFLQKNN